MISLYGFSSYRLRQGLEALFVVTDYVTGPMQPAGILAKLLIQSRHYTQLHFAQLCMHFGAAIAKTKFILKANRATNHV